MSESVLADDLHIKGEITTSGDIELKGTIEGEVTCRTLLIAEDAKIEGKATAEKVVVRGTVDGQINGIRVTLSSSARVTGELVCKALSVDEEAYFDGTSQRVNDPLAVSQEKSKSSSADLSKAANTNSSGTDKSESLKPGKASGDKLQPLGAGSAN
jgi:cytoskeletal protein CcmA (bactofilin family)